jgi:uncharacterized integral membrane protein
MIKIAFLILFIVLGTTFATLNDQEVSLHYFWGWKSGSFPLYIFILGSLLAGIILGFSYGWKKRWELRAEARRLKERAGALKDDLQTPALKEERPEEALPPPEVAKPPVS